MNHTLCVAQPRFSAGSRVRVRTGVTDPDLPDLPLGDWTGTVAQVEMGNLTAYLVRWTRKTLRTVPPALREYCEKEDAALHPMERRLVAKRAVNGGLDRTAGLVVQGVRWLTEFPKSQGTMVDTGLE